MNGEVNYNSIPLSALSYKSRVLLSSLLNTRKVIPSEDSDKLPRDWQGLAALVKIPSQLLSDNGLCHDKTAKVIEIWQQKKDGTATLGTLFNYLKKLDRFDICDDLEELSRQGILLEKLPLPIVPHKQISMLEDVRQDFLTKDDVFHGEPQRYHAYVLYAHNDKPFVDELLCRMRGQGFKLCTEDDILPGFESQFAPISTLLSERCHRIILIYSPDFFLSAANNFYINYVQADGIESNRVNIIPCMYRKCNLPNNHRYYHKLYYTPPGEKSTYDFWERLSDTLRIVDIPRIMNTTASQSSVDITEVGSSVSNKCALLPLPPITMKSQSATELSVAEDSQSLGSVSHASENRKNKKLSKFKRFLNFGKKDRKRLFLAESCLYK